MRAMSAPSRVDWPDLLSEKPVQRVATESLHKELQFAFAGSSNQGLFSEALDKARGLESTFEPELFARDLFLEEFVRGYFQFHLGGRARTPQLRYLGRLLVSPPRNLATVEFRRAILRELSESPETQSALELIYTLLSRLRTQLESTSTLDQRAPVRRQLDILETFHELSLTLAANFSTSSSGLRKLHDYGRSITESEPFLALSELLRFDASAATLTFKVALGGDGRVRRLDLLALKENTENAFVLSPWRRWGARFELAFRGFRFGEEEVVARLLDAAFEGIREHLVPLIQLYGDIEFYLGTLHFRSRAESLGYSVCLPTFVSSDQPRQLLGLYNPHLFASGMRPTPCDLLVDSQKTLVLVTGPNSGGKTRLLQSLAISQLLAQSGLFVPAKSAEFAPVPALIVSLLQETSADQSEGRLGVELVRIRALFERLPPGAMVLLDELCSGTNPAEGEEIVELVLQMLARLSSHAYLTTHFLEFATRLERERPIPELRFLKVLLGPRQEPTYQFTLGVAASSLAAETARRLGVTSDQLTQIVEAKLRAYSSAE